MSDNKSEDRREISIEADPERLYKAWAEPEHIAGWFADRASGEATEGGTLVHVFEKFGLEMPYKVVEVEPGARLVLSGIAPQGVPFRQEIRVHTRDGHSVLELIHSGFGGDADFADEYEGMDSGWTLALALLKLYAERYWSRPRTPYFALVPARFDYPQLAPYFRDAGALSGWLTNSGTIGEPGDPVALTLQDGSSLTGEVLARSSREVVISWAEIDGALELKAFDMGPEKRAVSLRASSWSDAAPDVATLESWLSARCTQLAGLIGDSVADEAG